MLSSRLLRNQCLHFCKQYKKIDLIVFKKKLKRLSHRYRREKIHI